MYYVWRSVYGFCLDSGGVYILLHNLKARKITCSCVVDLIALLYFELSLTFGLLGDTSLIKGRSGL